MPEWVLMYHPELKETNDEPPLVTRESYDLTWKDLGWRLWKPKAETSKEK